MQTSPDINDRITAIELMFEQLVTVLEAECPDFSADKLDRWINTCTQHMLATGSASPDTIGALWALQARVMGA